MKSPHTTLFLIFFFILYMSNDLLSAYVPSASTGDIDLNEYLDYLSKLETKPRSPQTLELYRRSLRMTKLDKIKRSEIENVWVYLRHLLNTKECGAIFVSKSKTVIKGALRLNNVPLERTKDYQFLVAELGEDKLDVEEYSEADIRTIL